MKRVGRVAGLLALLIAVSCAAKAQFHFGVRAGVGFPNMRTKTEVLGVKTTAVTDRLIVGTHFGIGGLYQLPLGDWGGLEFDGTLQAARLGGKQTIVDVTTLAEAVTSSLGMELTKDATIKRVQSFWHLQLPLRANVFIDVNVLDIVLGFGPQFGVALVGKETIKAGDQKTTNKIKFGEGGLNRFNLDLTTQAGIRLKEPMLGFAFYYNMGMLDINPSKLITTSHWSDLGLTVTYFF